jgi:hypothetical protein
MLLTDLEPHFLTVVVEKDVPTDIADADWEISRKSHVEFRDRTTLHRVETLAEAQGMWMLCPKCFQENGGRVGTHSVLVLFDGRGVPADVCIGTARWNVSGNSLADVTVTPSILVVGGCGWHGFVTNGQVTTV